jgi:hypothetical protein
MIFKVMRKRAAKSCWKQSKRNQPTEFIVSSFLMVTVTCPPPPPRPCRRLLAVVDSPPEYDNPPTASSSCGSSNGTLHSPIIASRENRSNANAARCKRAPPPVSWATSHAAKGERLTELDFRRDRVTVIGDRRGSHNSRLCLEAPTVGQH